MGKNYDLANSYKDTPLTAEFYMSIKDSMNIACRHYVLGHAFIIEKERRRESGESSGTLGSEYGYSKSSLDKFVSYARAIDYIKSFAPDLAEKIIDRDIRMSMENTLLLVQKKRSEIFRITELLADEKVKVCDIFSCRKRKTEKTSKQKHLSSNTMKKTPTIKDTPACDPDAPVSSLSYTIPSWVGTMERVFNNVDFAKISAKARRRLIKEMVVLADTAGVMLNLLWEDK